MSLNGSGIRDIARVLQMSPSMVIQALKKEPELHHVNQAVCQQIPPEAIEVEVQKVEAAEVDEMWSFVGKKAQQRWLWHACDHSRRVTLAYVCGTHEDEVFLQLKNIYDHVVSHAFMLTMVDVEPPSRTRLSRSRQTEHAKDRTQASHLTD